MYSSEVYNPIDNVLSMKAGSKAILRGWVYRERESGKMKFLVLRDASGIIQCVARVGCNGWEDAKAATVESSVEIVGTVKDDPRSPGGKEIEIESFKLINKAELFPINKGVGLEFLLDVRHLWLRSRRMNAILKIRDTVFTGIHNFFGDLGYYEVHAPSFVGAAVEGGSTLFEVKYFNKRAYLTQSAQFYLEALITSLERVYTVAPSFRAEKSRTWRHLTEYWHAEFEEAYADLNKVMFIGQGLVSSVVKAVLKNNQKELEYLKRDTKILENAVKTPYERIDYAEAVEIINKKSKFKVEYGEDFGMPHERVLAKQFDKPFFVTKFPRKAKAFYHQPEGDRTLTADLLAPEGYGEIIGGGQRIHDLQTLRNSVKEFGLKESDYSWYLDLRRFGSIPHAGFGLGVDRLVTWICGLNHIRDSIPFPRTPTRLTP